MSWPDAALNQASAVHALPAQVKLIALIGFVCCVVATPSEMWWPFLAHLALLVAVIALARLKPVQILRGLAVELPFVAFALALPLVATGPQVRFLGLDLSLPGLWAAWAVGAKSTLGVLAALTLAGTTGSHELVSGLRHLRAPRTLVEILTFMLRYLHLILGDWRRMSIARSSRGFQARNLHAWPALSGAVGAGFVRAYERGERAHLAMLSRGYSGRLPDAVQMEPPVRPGQWGLAILLPLAALAITLAAWGLR